MWDYRSIKAVFRLHQLGMVVATLLYFAFLSKINSTMIEYIRSKNLEQFQQVYVRGEIAKITGKPFCEISKCECAKDPPEYPMCLLVDKNINYITQGKCYGTGLCESKIRGAIANVCEYICRPADEIVYSVRFSESVVQGDIWSTWCNETITKSFVRQNGFRSKELKHLQEKLLSTLKGPVRVWIPREGVRTIHWNMPIKDGMFIVTVLTLISFALMVICCYIIASWMNHIYNLTRRRTEKIFADPNDSVLHIV